MKNKLFRVRFTIRSKQWCKECRHIDRNIKPLCGGSENFFISEKRKDYEQPKLELIPLDGDVVTASNGSVTIDWETEEFSLDDNTW